MLKAFFNLSPHLRIAVLLAPFLVVAGYVLTGLYSEEKHNETPPALELFVQGRCEVISGDCVLLRDNFSIQLQTISSEQSGIRLVVKPNQMIEGGIFSISLAGNSEPSHLRKSREDNNWYAPLNQSLQKSSDFRLVVIRNGVSYFAEVVAH